MADAWHDDEPESEDTPFDGPVPLDELYDDETLALIEAHRLRSARRVQGPLVGEVQAADGVTVSSGVSSVRRIGAQGAVLAGVMLGLGEVFEPERAEQAMVEFVPDAVDRHDQAVEFLYVHGSPQRSRIVFRPWLAR